MDIGRPRPGSQRRRVRSATHVNLMFRAVSDDTRIRLMQLLRRGPMCVGDLVAILRVPQPTASRHLAYLRRAGLVVTRRRRFWTFYLLAPPTSSFHGKLLGCLAVCFADVPEARTDAARAEKLRTKGGCCPEALRDARGDPI